MHLSESQNDLNESSNNMVWRICYLSVSLGKGYGGIFDLFRSGIHILEIQMLILFWGSMRLKKEKSMFDASPHLITSDAHGNIKQLVRGSRSMQLRCAAL